MRKRIRILSLTVALAMLLSLLPTTALATSPPGADGLSIEGGESGADKDYTYAGNVLTILTDTAMTISGTSATDQIQVAAGVTANLTFDNVSITRTEATPLIVHSGAELNLTLEGNSALTNQYPYSSGAIRLGTDNDPSGGALTILGSGTLTATGASSGVYSASAAGASLTVAGGTLNAYGEGNGYGGIFAFYSGITVSVSGGELNAYGMGENSDGICTNDYLTLSVTDGTLNACGTSSGICMNSKSSTDNKYDISFTGGTVNAWGACTFEADVPIRSDKYVSSAYGIWGRDATVSETRSFHIGGNAVVEATGYEGGIVLSDNTSDSATGSPAPVHILVDGNAELTAYGTGNHSIGLGGNNNTLGSGRTITITGDAQVTLARLKKNSSTYEYEKESYLGHDNNEHNRITLSGNAVLYSASGIGSLSDGNNGGTIEISGNASVGSMQTVYGTLRAVGGVEDSSYHAVIGGAQNGSGNSGGSGGHITIHTTGMVRAQAIGGNCANSYSNTASGGDGGNITIQNGQLFVNHIGGGYATAYDGTAIGGSGGVITISGGTLLGFDGQAMHGFIGSESSMWASAAIGGGGGTTSGGDGGTIKISGGNIACGISIAQKDGATLGGAAIGGGNDASGGSISISGGSLKVNDSSYPYITNVTDSGKLPAFIGGGSGGAAGQITISGGTVNASPFSVHNDALYRADASTLGAGKGATDATGWVKVTGGSLAATGNLDESRPATWPTTADGSTTLYPVMFTFYDANTPDNTFLPGGDYSVVSMTLTDASGKLYDYGVNHIAISNGAPTIWLPIDIADLQEGIYKKVYDITLKVKQDNTVHQFTGQIRSRKTPGSTIFYRDDVDTHTDLTYGSTVTAGIQLTSDFGGGAKTYNGADQSPVFTVKNELGQTLTKGTDYTLQIEFDANDAVDDNWIEVTEMKNSGGYRVTAIGKDGTAYEGLTSQLGFGSDPLWINAKTVVAELATPVTFTKQYDGNRNLCDADGNEIDQLALKLRDGQLCAGDTLTNIALTNPMYSRASVGTDINISGSVICDGISKNNYHVIVYEIETSSQSTITGSITIKQLTAANIDSSEIVVTKVYDGTTTCTPGNVKGSLKLKDLIGTEVAAIAYTGVSDFSSGNAGANHTVTLTLDRSVTGENAANYGLPEDLTAVAITNAKITPADYSYSLTAAQQAQEFTQGGSLSQVVIPQQANGVHNEKVTGVATLYTDAACTTAATDAIVGTWTTGAHNLYVKFIPAASETNYTDKVTTGQVVVVTVVEAAPQTITWSGAGALNTTYGTAISGHTASVTETDGGSITYASSNLAVATVDANTGALTIVGAGTCQITATAAQVDGKYRETSSSYTLEVAPKAITVTVDPISRQFGAVNPTFTVTVTSGMLVGADTIDDLGLGLTTTATRTSNVGLYSVTGDGTYNTNYHVTVVGEDKLTITKADAPTIATIVKNLYYNVAHSDVTVDIADLPTDRGTTAFAAGAVTGDSSIISGAVLSTATGVKFSTNVGTEHQSAAIPVTITMQNYADTTVSVVVTLVNKTPIAISGVTATGKTYDGAALTCNNSAITFEPAYEGNVEYLWNTPDKTAPKNVGTYTLTVKIPDSDGSYMGSQVIENIIIAPKALTIKPADQTIYNGAALPTSFALEYVGIVAGDTLTPTLPATFELQNAEGAPLPDSKTNGSYVIAWTNKENVTFTDANYTIVKTDGTLTISSRPSGGGGGGAVTPPVTAAPEVSTNGGSATATVEISGKTSGTMTTATVDKDTVVNAIDAALDAAGINGNAAVEIKVSTPANADSLQLTLPGAAMEKLADSKAETLTITSDAGEITISSEAAASIARQAGSSHVTVTISKIDKEKTLNERQQAAIGNATVYDLSIIAGSKYIPEFDGGLMTVTLPYTLKAGEDPAGVVIWYMDENGNIQRLRSMYDVKTKTVVFTTNHLSLYVIGYDEIAAMANPFTDVAADAYYRDSAVWAYTRQVTMGTSATTFSPNTVCTRAQVVTFLWRTMGSPEPSIARNPFTDVNADAYYYKAVLWALEKGITSGTSATTFSPDATVTRGQVVTFQYRAAGSPSVTPAAIFTDVATDAYYANAVTWAVSENITSGTSTATFSPNADCTRSQIVTFLYRMFGK